MKRQKLNNCLIVCDGDISRQLLSKYIKQNERSSFAIISADGASNILLRFDVVPDYIVGDLDAIFPDVLQRYKQKGAIIKKVIDQEHNDFEKCIMFALSKGMNNITVIGYGGKRIDHTINNFNVLKRFYKKCNIRFIDDMFEVFMINNAFDFDYKKGEVVSIQGFPKADGIVTEGLQYQLKNETLEFGIRSGALNRAISDNIKISMKKGELLVFIKHFDLLSFPRKRKPH